MALISEYNKKKKPSSYATVFGIDNQISTLMADFSTAIHSTKIRNGIELENTILETTFYDTRDYKKQLLNDEVKEEILSLDRDTVLAGPKVNTGYLKDKNGKQEKTELDNTLILPSEKKIIAFEIKDGDNFDTKKIQSEKEKLERTENKLKEWFPDYTVESRFVLYCREFGDNSVIPTDFTGRYEDKGWVMDGDTGSALLGTSRTLIDRARQTDQKENSIYSINFCRRICELAGSKINE